MNQPAQDETFVVHVDGATAEACSGDTILDVAGRCGVEIPTLCHLAGAEPFRSCSVCLVAVEGRAGLVLACATPACPDMRVVTDREDVLVARRTAVELLLSEHNGECLAPCERACPASWDIPGFMAAMPAGDAADAARLAREGLALPATLGYVCQGQCQKPCRSALRGDAVPIRDLHRQALEAVDSATGLPRRAPPTGRRVAIVGAGAAGLAAACRLLQRGHGCTLFDAREAAGGALLDEPAERLPPEVLAAEVASIVALGAELRLAQPVGAAPTLDELLDAHDAVLLTVGSAHALTDLGLDVPNPKRVADPRTRAAARPRLFVAGGAAGKGKIAIRAVADGFAAAESIDQLLRGAPVTGPPRPLNVRYDDLDDDTLDQLFGVAPDPAGAGAERCLQCGCRATSDCDLRRVATDLGASLTRLRGARRPFTRDASHPEVVHESHKCILCGACVHVARERDGDAQGIALTRRGFATRVAAAYDEPLGAALSPEVAAAVAAVCPTGALRPRGRGD